MDMNDLLVLLNLKESKLISLENGVKRIGKIVQQSVMKLKAAITLDTVLVIEGAICYSV